MGKDKKTFNDVFDLTSPTPTKFPIDIFPGSFVKLADEAYKALAYPPEYMGGGFLFTGAICNGNAYRLKITEGWLEPSMLWMIQVGRAAGMKTPPLKMTAAPIRSIDANDYAEWKREMESFNKLDKKEKEDEPEPKLKRHLFNDFTIEALLQRHGNNQQGIAVMKNELSGWLGSMNEYKSTSGDQGKWINIWDGDLVDVDRIIRGFDVVEQPNVSIIGGIQPVVLQGYLSNGTTSFSGFSDRLLYLHSEAKIKPITRVEVDHNAIDEYYRAVKGLENKLRNAYDDNDGVSKVIYYSPDAFGEFMKIDEAMTNKINGDISEAEGRYISKLRTYFHRIALTLEILGTIDSGNIGEPVKIHLSTVEKTKKLIDYFHKSYLIVNDKTSTIEEMKNVLGVNRGKSKKELVKIFFEKGFKPKDVAMILGLHLNTVYNYKS